MNKQENKKKMVMALSECIAFFHRVGKNLPFRTDKSQPLLSQPYVHTAESYSATLDAVREYFYGDKW